jgi:hypothetical protein
MTYTHTFPPPVHDENICPPVHDENICAHILAGHEVTTPVEHIEHEDGSLSVVFPLTQQEVEDAIASYDPEATVPIPFQTMTPADVAALPPNGNGALGTVKAILAKQDADITPAEVKTLVLLMARYFLRKWLNGWR